MYEMKDIEQILLCFDNSSLTELEIRKESTGYFLRLKRTSRNNPKKQNENNSTNPVSEKQIGVKSERVGFFNSQTSEGISVKKGEIIGEIISLKTSTSITSPCDGKIVKIHPGNGDPVEYGQLLILIDLKN